VELMETRCYRQNIFVGASIIASIIGSGINGNMDQKRMEDDLRKIASIIGSGINGNFQAPSILPTLLLAIDRFYYWKWN